MRLRNVQDLFEWNEGKFQYFPISIIEKEEPQPEPEPEIYKRNNNKYNSVGRLWKELLMYELYGPLINLGALSRCPNTFVHECVSVCVQVAVINFKFMFISRLDFECHSFFFRFYVFGKENLPHSKKKNEKKNEKRSSFLAC